MQVLECISCVNQLKNAIERTDNEILPPELVHLVHQLQYQLETLRQTTAITEDDTSGQIDHTKVVTTAELYRIATLIYLHRSVIFTPQTSPAMQKLVSKSLSILTKLEVCTSPWPLFLTACEVLGDDQRMIVLNVIEKMQTERRIANVEIIRGVLEGVWKRSDLIGGTERVDWKLLIGDGQRMPSFI